MDSDCEPTPKKARRVGAHDGAVLTASYNRDGRLYFTGGADQVVHVWNSCDGSSAGHFADHGSEVRDVCVTPDDSKLSSCCGDGQVLYWDFATERLLRKFEGQYEVNAVKINEFGSVIVSADSSVRLWDCRSPSSEPMQIFDTFKAGVMSLCLRDRAEIIAGCLDGSVQKFDLRNNNRLSLDLESPVTCISMGNRGTCIVASLRNSTFQLLHVETDSIREGVTYYGHTCESSKVGCCFTKDTTHVVGGSEDGCIFIWDLVSQEVVSEFDAHSAAVTSVDYHPTEDCMVSASVDGSVVLWKDAITV